MVTMVSRTTACTPFANIRSSGGTSNANCKDLIASSPSSQSSVFKLNTSAHGIDQATRETLYSTSRALPQSRNVDSDFLRHHRVGSCHACVRGGRVTAGPVPERQESWRRWTHLVPPPLTHEEKGRRRDENTWLRSATGRRSRGAVGAQHDLSRRRQLRPFDRGPE